MDEQCSATTRTGGRCQRSVDGPHGFCWGHAPENAAQRSRQASRAGKSKPSRDLLQTRAQLQGLADSVLAGEVDRANAAVAGQLLNIKLRTVEIERRLLETQELERRLGELEESIEQNNTNHGRGRAWG